MENFGKSFLEKKRLSASSKILFFYQSSAEETKNIMQLKTKSFRKPADGVVSGKIFWNAQNLFMSDEENWKRFRTLLTPAFSDHSLSDIFNDHIMPQMNELYDHINREKNVNITKMFQLFTFDIIGKKICTYFSKGWFWIRFQGFKNK